ncbi:4659_t:CDS:1, partial [Diversispora eburnea]
MSYYPNTQINVSGTSTDWRLQFTEEDRKNIVSRLFKGLEFLNKNSEENFSDNQRFFYSKNWENEAYNIANSRDEYNSIIGAKLKELTTRINTAVQRKQQHVMQHLPEQIAT